MRSLQKNNIMPTTGLSRKEGEDFSELTDINDFIRAMIIEYYAKSSGELLDLTVNDFHPGPFLRYIGNSRLIIPSAPGNIGYDHLSDNIIEIVEEERKDQEWFFKKVDSKYEAFGWISDPYEQGRVSPGRRNRQIFASIGSSRWITWEKAGSYIGSSSLGILGKYEKEKRDIIFIDPL